MAAPPAATGTVPAGRRARRRRGPDGRPALPSVTEITVYTGLAAVVASGVFLAGGRPTWHVGVVWAAAALIVTILVLTSRRAGRPTPLPAEPDLPSRAAGPAGDATRTSTGRHGRRRRP